jgi:hypothetical protein
MITLLLVAALGLLFLSFAPPPPPSAPAAGSTPPDAWWANDPVVVKPPSPPSQPPHFQAQLVANAAAINDALYGQAPIGNPNFLDNWQALKLDRNPRLWRMRELLGLPSAAHEAFVVSGNLRIFFGSIFEYRILGGTGYVLLQPDRKIKTVIVPPNLTH